MASVLSPRRRYWRAAWNNWVRFVYRVAKGADFGRERTNFSRGPPGLFIPGLMQLPVVPAAEGHREFVADLKRLFLPGGGSASAARV
jgi:hypothetical protein